jgi:hypothetical protein
MSSPPTLTPIIVVGMNRSGTKWLSNILCNHPEVFGAQAKSHKGIIETNLFGKLQDLLGDIGPVEHYIAFVELWTRTDFFRATGVEKEFLYERRDRPRDMLEAFRLTMEEAARRRGARFWLQKTSPIEAIEVLHLFPDARVVTIQRGLVPTLESGAKMWRDRGQPYSVLRAAAVYAYEAKLLRRVERDFRAVHVTYEALSRNPEQEIRSLCDHIGLSCRPEMISTPFEANTSFTAGARSPQLKSQRVWVARATAALVDYTPLPLLRVIRGRLRRRRALLVTRSFDEIATRHGLR